MNLETVYAAIACLVPNGIDGAKPLWNKGMCTNIKFSRGDASMQALQNPDLLSSGSHAMDQLHDFLRQRREASAPVEDCEHFEQDLHRLFVAAEREAVGHELARFDLEGPQVEVEGARYDRGLRCETTYNSAAGPVRVERSLYRSSSGGRAICPLELRVGMREGYWTPLAAKQATWAVAHLTPQESEDLFELIGHMTPSKSTRDRLPQALSAHWAANRPQFAATLHPQETIPQEAVSMAVSLDGVMAPMQDGNRQAKRQDAVAQGKSPSGPSGYQEVGCAPVSYYDRFGERLLTRRMARMPETKKATLKSQLTAEVMGALIQRPALRVVKVADGTADNWTSLSETLPCGEEGLDFSHAVDHLSAALSAVYGEGTPTYQEHVATLHEGLRDTPQGVDRVIEALCRLRSRSPRRQAMHKTIAYFREPRPRMRYSDLRARFLPIGSGVVEAACKTRVAQRLKRSGMRWRVPGGQAILTLRALCQSARFERAWPLLVETYKQTVTLPRKVIALSNRR
jgi:hypothetical protein